MQPPTDEQFHLLIAPSYRDEGPMACLAELHQAQLLAQVDIFTEPMNRAWYRRQAKLRGFEDVLRLHSPRPSSERACIATLAFVLGEMLAWHKGSPCNARLVLIASQRTALAIPGLAQSRHGTSLLTFPALNRSMFAELLADSSLGIDTYAIEQFNRLVESHGREGFVISRWADRLIEWMPTLANSAQRRTLLGTVKFSKYARLLGIRTENERLYPSACVQPRPRLQDLVQIHRELSGRSLRCLFLRWANTLLARFPVLQDASLRKMLFGKDSLEELAACAGLMRHGQWLHASRDRIPPALHSNIKSEETTCDS